jgi:DNA-binding XRE family transcriptional regulator
MKAKYESRLGPLFFDLLASLGMTQEQLATKCDLNKTTIWKIVHGLPVRWETVHLALAVMNYCEGMEVYANAHAAWLRDRAKMAEALPKGHAKVKMSLSRQKIMADFRKKLGEMKDGELVKVRRMIARMRS